MPPTALQEAAFPRWVNSIQAPVWVTGPDRTLTWINEQAARLLDAAVGQSCYRAVGATDPRGLAVCALDCPIRDRVRRGSPLSPSRLLVGRGPPGTRKRLLVLLIPVRRKRDAAIFIVHAVVSAEQESRADRYLRRVAGRWRPRGARQLSAAAVPLTRREEQVLDLLMGDEDLHAIAGEIGVTYVTVRNHVQHILHKLGVHSIQEAVASELLAGRREEG